MKDWAIRAIKTFIQAFFGVLVPAIYTMLSNGWPESVSAAWVILAPTVAAALAAAICAVWNIVLEALDNAPDDYAELGEDKNPNWAKPPDTVSKTDKATIEFIRNGFLRHDGDGKD